MRFVKYAVRAAGKYGGREFIKMLFSTKRGTRIALTCTFERPNFLLFIHSFEFN